jgi:hypothetical protein
MDVADCRNNLLENNKEKPKKNCKNKKTNTKIHPLFVLQQEGRCFFHILFAIITLFPLSPLPSFLHH